MSRSEVRGCAEVAALPHDQRSVSLFSTVLRTRKRLAGGRGWACREANERGDGVCTGLYCIEQQLNSGVSKHFLAVNLCESQSAGSLLQQTVNIAFAAVSKAPGVSPPTASRGEMKHVCHRSQNKADLKTKPWQLYIASYALSDESWAASPWAAEVQSSRSCASCRFYMVDTVPTVDTVRLLPEHVLSADPSCVFVLSLYKQGLHPR